jgi:alginate O-acetyltransferase complex protein AlgI
LLFNSHIFIFVFLPLVLTGYYLLKPAKFQLLFLLLSSLAFYAYWSVPYLGLLIFIFLLDFYLAHWIFHTASGHRRTVLLVLSVSANIGILFFFKYYPLIATTINYIHPLLPTLALALPIGISFYTFQSLSYVIDVYRGHSRAHASLLSYASYVTMFPHQISGPLVRHNNIVPQLQDPATYRFTAENFWRGCYFFIVGLSKKILIADFLSRIVDPAVTNIVTISNTEAWIAMLGYTLQLYFDFSGYSDMATGLCLMMNIRLPQNFNSPYRSASITEFWQRWHISLSSWLKDYLYISLGGNRGTLPQTYRNLILTMLIGGLWHGASWMFALWGLFHGLLLAIERLTGFGRLKTLPWLRILLTFFLVNIGWVMFRSPDLGTLGTWLQKIFFLNHQITWDILSLPIKHRDRFAAALLVGFFIAFWRKNTWQIQFKPTAGRAVLLAVLFCICLSFLGEESPFLYFQF